MNTTTAYASPLLKSVMAVTKQWAESRSKDPTSKVGACVYDYSTGGMFLGYNGFPSGITDSAEIWNRREDDSDLRDQFLLTKYDLSVHAEVNAVRKALTAGVDMRKAVLLCTHIPCPSCMKDMIASCGIKEIFYLTDEYRSLTPRGKFVIKSIADAINIRLVKMEI